MIYTLPFIAAAIGWFTNYLAVKMLFRPKEEVKFLFFKFQGVFPKRQKAVAIKLGKLVSEELLSLHDIKDKLKDPENIEVIHKTIEARVDEYLTTTLPTNYPFMSILLGKKTKGRIKEDLMREIEELAPLAIDQYITKMENSFDIEELVRNKVSILSPEKLEKLIMGILSKEFQFIELIGAFIGFVIGLLQVGMILISN